MALLPQVQLQSEKLLSEQQLADVEKLIRAAVDELGPVATAPDVEDDREAGFTLADLEGVIGQDDALIFDSAVNKKAGEQVLLLSTTSDFH